MGLTVNSLIHDIVRPYLHDSTNYTTETVQSLWSGYGELIRYSFPTTKTSLIVKLINLMQQSESEQVKHPRGWQSNISHQRKLSSYHNEIRFYQHYAGLTQPQCAVPKLIASGDTENCIWLVMEDLNARGLTERYIDADMNLAKLGIQWLANFHACFIQQPLHKVWPVGTYWHLATRPQEWNVMENSLLKSCASKIDSTLNNAHYKTLLHGDAKLANFCFHPNHLDLAAVDFQYTGSGVGIKDLVYFVGSCFYDDHLACVADELIDFYFAQLKQALLKKSKPWSQQNLTELESEWRKLVPFAWADFERFLRGWAPKHKKLNTYSYQQTKLALHEISPS